MKRGKFSAVLFSIFLCALISMSMISPAKASIERITWLPPYIKKGYDSYYGDNVVIYRDGSTVRLTVPVENDGYPNGLNVSSVIVSFDWGQNKTLDLSANIEQVGWLETEIFTVSFAASVTEAVTSDWAHEYVIYVEHVNATSGPTKIVGTWSRPYWWWSPSYLFVVFSTDQADALVSSEEYNSYASSFPTYTFTSINASQLAGRANIEALLGETYLERGEYDSAKTQYQEAINLYDQALTAEKNWKTKIEEAELQMDLTETEANMATANAMLRHADAAMNQSYAWIVFGLGFAFMGIATIIYASKTSKVAK